MEKNKCKFCDSEIHIEKCGSNSAYICNCPVCGKHVLTDTAFEMQIDIDPIDRILFSGYLKNRPDEEKNKKIYSNMLTDIPQIVASFRNLSVSDKINNILRYIGDKSKFINQRAELDKNQEFTLFYCKNKGELRSILEHLRKMNYILGEESESKIRAYLTIDGWNRYEQIKVINLNSKKVFVAMDFGNEWIRLFADTIFPICEQAGFKAELADSHEHNEKICDKIIGLIRESRFVIAEFTVQNNGVYYEAGFAEGLGLPVIRLCRKQEIDDNKLHFDIRQYSYVAWETSEDLSKKLYDRIKATIV